MVTIDVYRPEQIGGQITVISSATTKIIIDLGMNLPGSEEEDIFNNKQEIDKITKNCDAIFYTHYHGDHIGLFHLVDEHIPQYIGEVAQKVVVKKYETLLHIPNLSVNKRKEYEDGLRNARKMNTFRMLKQMRVGDISVTPFLVSHSAYDSYMFLIKAGNKKILHTGDFRGHGYFGEKVLDALKKYVGQVDVLIIEGTMLNREDDKSVMDEHELSRQAQHIINDNKYVFIHCSSTDIERLASFKSAARKAKRVLVGDGFQADILRIFSDTAGKMTPLFDFGKVYSYSPGNDKLDKYMIDCGFVMFIRATDKFNQYLDHLMPMLDFVQIKFIYSMWGGYIDSEMTRNMAYVNLQKRFSSVIRLHTSGHAKKEMLLKICKIVNPTESIIPVHREKNSDFASIGLPDVMVDKLL